MSDQHRVTPWSDERIGVCLPGWMDGACVRVRGEGMRGSGFPCHFYTT